MDQLAGHILILSGPPGSGKTTTAATLAHLPGVPKVHLHSDDFWGYIKHGLIAPWLPQSHAQNVMISQIAASVAAQYARHGYFVVLDGVVRPWWLPAFAVLDVPLHYVVLRPTRDEAVARCQARGGDSLTDPAVVADLHNQFSELGTHERHVLPTDGLDRQQTLDAVIAALDSGRFRL
ncbi:MAG: ATP-binding protein [Alphaproteobacteria bacterium]|nr:ATP-binding protein [Alphaproteobacteria bacterium]MBU1561164.1 ATP-binding protein [Alphaproteobacteria bacterium]MBU2302451.1 ATP-binding protein [Alphaproteobacteria bacterium]MBU2366599.1 ATP-binding protein [Alphaproteobacteria bacterium]